MTRKRRHSDTSNDEWNGSDGPTGIASGRSRKQAVTRRTKAGTKARTPARLNVREPDGLASETEQSPVTSLTLQDRPHSASIHRLSQPDPMRASLLAWYDKVHDARGMPWRKPYNSSLTPEERAQRAYEVWISEIMLQQTQVATVIPYYNKWMTKFPTIKDLAASNIDTVNGLWKGLGYYSRAARLLGGAKKAVDELGGRLPDNAKDMEAKIPGIGRYSAGAICSIAYNQCAPVLDGNVHRLLSRVLAVHAPPKGKQTLDALWAGATAMVEGSDRPGDLNQALIELGSTVCKVRNPACGSCPLQMWCTAYQDQDPQGKVENGISDVEDLCTLCEPLQGPPAVTTYPMKAERRKAREELDIVNVIEWHSATSSARWFLLVKRPEGGLLAGLYEFPTSQDVPVTMSATAAAIREIPHKLLSELLAVPLQRSPKTQKLPKSPPEAEETTPHSEDDLRIVQIKPAGDVIHIFSHIKKTYRVQWVVLEGGTPDPPTLTRPSPIVGDSGGLLEVKSSSDKARKAKRRVTGGHGQPSHTFESKWTLMDDVPDANVGTGVLKIWKQVSTLWARP